MKLKLQLVILLCLTLNTNAQEINYTVKVEYLTTIDWEVPKSYNSTLYINDSTSLFILKNREKSKITNNIEDKTRLIQL